MAKVTGFLFDNSEIAYYDASGNPVKLRTLFDAATNKPFQQVWGDTSLVICAQSETFHYIRPGRNYWLLFMPLHRAVKDYFYKWPNEHYTRLENWMIYAVNQEYDCRWRLGNYNILQYWWVWSNVSSTFNSVFLSSGQTSGFVVFRAMSLTPLLYTRVNYFNFDSTLGPGCSCVVSWCLSPDGSPVPDASAFTAFPLKNNRLFIPWGSSGYLQSIWFRVDFTRPPEDLAAPCVLHSVDLSLKGYLWL